jgi:hypothetical protein
VGWGGVQAKCNIDDDSYTSQWKGSLGEQKAQVTVFTYTVSSPLHNYMLTCIHEVSTAVGL